jgi:hypothetical protein
VSFLAFVFAGFDGETPMSEKIDRLYVTALDAGGVAEMQGMKAYIPTGNPNDLVTIERHGFGGAPCGTIVMHKHDFALFIQMCQRVLAVTKRKDSRRRV